MAFSLANAIVSIDADNRPLHSKLNKARDELGRFVAQPQGLFSRLGVSLANPFGSVGLAIGGLNRPLGSIDSMVVGLARKFGGFAKTAAFALGGAAVAGTAALGTGLYKAVEGAIDLESKFIDIRKVTGFGDADTQTLQVGLKAIATDASLAGVSLEDVLGIAETGGRLGIAEQGTGAMLSFTRALAMVKVAMDDIPVEEAANRMGQVLNVFHLGAGEALSFASVVDKMADTTTASSRDVLDVTQRISGTAKVIGLSIPQVAALSAAMLDVGISSEVAGTAMSAILGKMTAAPETFARVAGMSTQAFNQLRTQNPLEALKGVLAGLSKLSPEAQFAALGDLGIEGERARMVMLQLGQTVGRLDGMVATANQEWTTQASILGSVQRNSQKTSAVLQNLWNGVQITAASIGALFLPALRGLATTVGGAGQSLSAFVDQNQATFAGWFAQVGAFLAPLGAAFQAAFAQVGAAFQSVMGVASAEGWASGIGTYFTFARDTVVAVIQEITTWIGTLAANGTLTTWATTVGTAYTWLRDTIMAAVETIGVMYRNWADIAEIVGLTVLGKLMNIGEIFNWLAEVGGQFLGWLGSNWYKVWYEQVNLAWTAIQNFGSNLQKFFPALTEFLADPLHNTFQFDWTPLLQGFETTFSALPEIAAPHLSSLQTEIDAVTQRMSDVEQKRRDTQAAAAGTAPGTAPAAPAAPGPAPGATPAERAATAAKAAGGGGVAAADKEAGKFVDIAQWAKGIQAAAFKGGGATAEQQLTEQRKGNAHLGKIAEAMSDKRPRPAVLG